MNVKSDRGYRYEVTIDRENFISADATISVAAYDHDAHFTLTPTEARHLAACLMEAADRVPSVTS